MEGSGVVALIEQWLEGVAYLVDLGGVLVILIGFALGLTRFVAVSINRQKRVDQYDAVRRARCTLGTYLLFGLELLIVSDVLRSVVSHSLEDLASLGLLVVIRTLIAYFLGREIEEMRTAEKAES